MDPRLLVRMARLARRPPSRRGVIAVLTALGLILLLVGIESVWGWPSWLMPERTGLRTMRLP